ncbi:MAG: PilZ domain-containing protein [Gammaproteobacteria bacterium]|nr:PilZ domain-containing protein [Gammaproteobacteria bacterium]
MTTVERLHYQRIPFLADIIVSQNEQLWNAELEDISLKGLLIKPPEEAKPILNEIYDIILVLSKDATIKMQAEICHFDESNWGMQWENIDIECFSHLRRLLELNTQDPDIVHRELSELGKPI